MIGWVVSLTTMAIAGRELSGELTVFQILLIRSVVALVVLFPLLSYVGWDAIRTRNLRFHFLRNIAHFGGQYGWFFGIAFIPFAEVFAIEFTTPLWTAILAALFLGERLTASRVTAILCGFVGILIILRPGLAIIDLPALAVLAGAFGYAVSFTVTKRLIKTDPPIAILFYMYLIQLPFALGPSIPDWVTPSLALWPWILLVGLTGLTSHYCLTRAVGLADATVVVPMDFLRLPLAVVIGFLAYREPVDVFVVLGAGLIVAGTFLNVWRERQAESK